MVLLFAGESFYARGGMNDFKGSFTDVYSAMNSVEIMSGDNLYDNWEWWQIIDQYTLNVIAQSDNQAYGTTDKSYCPDRNY